MSLYAGCDLHSNNNHWGLVDQKGKRVDHWKLANDPELILRTLKLQRSKIVGVVVESTYNWYWLVDALMEADYRVHLANPAAIQQYSGLKHADDKHDAYWLAQMLRLGILPGGYIYPKEERPTRDLLRKRGHLVRLRTSLMLSLQNVVERNFGVRISGNEMKRLKEDRVRPLFSGHEDLGMVGAVSKEAIDFLTRQIRRIEKVVEERVELRPSYRYLLTLPGVGKILALTIMLETGPISRFSEVGNYASYCRKVSSQWLSNEKAKGKGNAKSGNKYLAWAFSEAAELAGRFDAGARAYYQRKQQKTNRMVAHSALAHKLARAAYYLMREQVPFQPERLFS